MNDQELADAVVALGVGRTDGEWSDLTPRYIAPNSSGWHGADGFVRDWRVAGALMEKLELDFCVHINRYKLYDVDVFDKDCLHVANQRNESLPRAIIEACASALTGQKI